MFKSDILFNGYYGQRNTGDDAFVEVSSWAANTIWNTHDIRYLAIKEHLPITLAKIKGFPLSVRGTYSLQQNRLIDKTKVFISAGGSIFHNEINSKSSKFRAHERKLKGDRFKIGAIGVSIGPFKDSKSENSVTEYIKSLDFISLRDKRSFEFANSLHLPFKPIEAFDLAALLPKIYLKNPSSSNHKTIGVSLCNFERFNSKDTFKEDLRNNRVIELIKEVNSKEVVNFKFFVINGHSSKGDLELTLKTIASCGLVDNFEIIYYDRKTQNVWDNIANCNFMFSTRLHGAIFACFAGVPFLLVEYHKKCSDFLDDVGFEQKFRIGDLDANIEDITFFICNVLNNTSNFSTPIYLEQMKEKALLNFTSIKL